MQAFSWLVLVFCCTLAAAPAQRQTWIVDQRGGPGVHFTEIGPAIATANPGDRIEVIGVTNITYKSFTLTKGVDLEGVGTVWVGYSEVRDVPASEWLRISGMVFTGFDFSGEPRLRVQRCQGPVLLSHIETSSVYSPGIAIADCLQVLILDGSLRGSLIEGYPTPALVVEHSSVHLQRCVATGARGQNAGFGGGSGGGGGIALYAVGSNISAAQSSFVGGNGGDGRCFNCNCGGGPGGAGISTDGPLLLYANCRAAGGVGGSGIPCSNGQPGAPVWARGPSARVTTDCTLVHAPINVMSIPPLPWVQSPIEAKRGTTATFTFTAKPQTVILLYMDGLHGYLPVPGIDGPFLLTGNPIGLSLLVVGASGTLPLALAVPQDPSLEHQFVFFHGVALEPGRPMPSLTNLGDLRLR
jgi:hypothetical protein